MVCWPLRAARKRGLIDRITGIALPEKAYLPLCKWGVQLGSFQITRVEVRRFASYLNDKGETEGCALILKRLGVLCPEWVTPLRAEFALYVGETLYPFLGKDIRAIARDRERREGRLLALKARLDLAKQKSPLGDMVYLEEAVYSLLQEIDMLEKQYIE